MGSVAHPLIKAIPTPYSGVVFRSRLEARWAVFFDYLKIEWEYEPFGFRLRKPTWKKRTISYIPDFHLPRNDVWVEVKRGAESIDDAEYRRIVTRCELVAERTKRPVVLCHGMPAHEAYLAFGPTCPYGEACDDCELDASACDTYGNHRAIFMPEWVAHGRRVTDRADFDGTIHQHQSVWDFVSKAIAAATSYDFTAVPFPDDLLWLE